MVMFAGLRTPGGYLNGEVASAMQKAIRRNREAEALFWASELDLGGYGNYVWKRLRIIATEDVGIADSSVAVLVRSLYENWNEARKSAEDADRLFPRIFLTHAVVALCRAPKSRLIDHATVATYLDRPELEIPDYALDNHTGRGRQLGRGVDYFYDVSAKLVPRARIEDPYKPRARKALKAREDAGVRGLIKLSQLVAGGGRRRRRTAKTESSSAKDEVARRRSEAARKANETRRKNLTARRKRAA